MLPLELIQHESFEASQKDLKKCKKHGQNPSKEQVDTCFTCQVATGRIHVKISPHERTQLQPEEEEKARLKRRDLRKAVGLLKKEVDKMPIFTVQNLPQLTKDGSSHQQSSIDVDGSLEVCLLDEKTILDQSFDKSTRSMTLRSVNNQQGSPQREKSKH